MTTPVFTYKLLLFLKFLGVLCYSGGLVASFVSGSLPDRKRAVHAIASPGLLVTWIAGYLLSVQLGVPLTELWILSGLVLSLLSQIALVRSVARDTRSTLAFVSALTPLLLVLLCMVFRPTWAGVGT